MAPLRHWVVTPNCKYTSSNYWFVAQELKFKVSKRSELNWQRYREVEALLIIYLRHTHMHRQDRHTLVVPEQVIL